MILKILKTIELLIFFLVELWKSNIRVAKDILRPHPVLNPAIVAMPVELTENWAITLLANLITLTPGTLSFDISPDKKTLFIHTIYLDNKDKKAFIESIKIGFEKRILFLEGKQK